MSRLNHPFKDITTPDIIHLVNAELSRLNASHNLGAAMFSSLNFGVNNVVCSSKKFKSSVKLYINKSFGDFRGFVIHSQTKEGNLATFSGMDCWLALNDGNRPLPRAKSAEEIEQARVDAELAESQRKANEMGRKELAASLYAKASETGENAYLARKNVIAQKNVRFAGRNLIIPLYQLASENNLEIFGVQSIGLNGKKTNGIKKNSFFPIGNIENPKNIYFCEGYATSSSIYESLTCKNDSLVVMAVDAGNMLHVVDIFVEKFADVYNSHGFTLCCDNDMWKEKPADRFTGFKTARTISKKHPKVLISYPFFRHEFVDFYKKWCFTDEPTDYNDYSFWDIGNHDAEKVKFSPSEFFSQIYDFKNNSLCDADKQQALRELKLITPIKRDVLKICAPVLPLVYIDRATREVEKLAAVEKMRADKAAIDEKVKAACAESDDAVGVEFGHLPKTRLKKVQSAQRKVIRDKGNLEKKLIELTAPRAEKFEFADMSNVDSEANAIAAYFYPFKDVEMGMVMGKFTQITSKYVDIPLLQDGATELFYCGMGSGKTTNFIKQSIELIEQIYLTENRVANILVYCPRKQLTYQLVSHLNRALNAWKSDNNISDSEIPPFYSYETLKKGGIYGQKIQANLLVSTVHSAKFFDTDNFDLVIADEFHQSRNCFIQRMENARENFDVNVSTIQTAHRFLATGADLSQSDIDFIENLRGQSRIHYQLPANQNKHVTFYYNKKELVKMIADSIMAGERLIIASNSKAFIKAVAKLLDRAKISNLAMFDEVTGEPNISRFTDNPNSEIEQYQVILYSPVIVSGVSFDEFEGRTDRKIFGYFTNRIGTASDAWQMLGRFRGNGTQYHVFISDSESDVEGRAKDRIETQLKRLIEQWARSSGSIADLQNIPLVKRCFNEKAGQIVDYTDFDNHAFSLQDEEVASQRNYFADFVMQMLAQKITFSMSEVCDVDEDLQEALRDSSEAVKTEDIQRVVHCNSAPINEKRREEIKNKSRVNQVESAEAKHFDYRMFLAATELSERDVEFMTKRGKSKIYAIERGNSELLPIHLKQAQDELEGAPISLMRFGFNNGELVMKLLEVVGLQEFEDGQIQLTPEWCEWKGRIHLHCDNVKVFYEWAWENRLWINRLQIADLPKIKEGFNESMVWINSALAAIGVKMNRHSQIYIEEFDARIVNYCVDIENIDFINGILARRFKKIHSEKLAELSAPPAPVLLIAEIDSRLATDASPPRRVENEGIESDQTTTNSFYNDGFMNYPAVVKTTEQKRLRD